MISKRMLVFFICLVLVLSACSSGKEVAKDSKISCSTDDDCRSEEKCTLTKCSNGECLSKKSQNCCGNGICEEAANESICNCADDCKGNCSGSVEFIVPTGSKQKAKYFDYGCINGRCIIKYDTSEIDPREEYLEIDKENIILGMTVKYIQPFVIKKENLGIELEFKNYDKDKVKMPIRINEIRIMESSLILGRKKSINKEMKNISNSFYVEIPIIYSMALPEEQKKVNIEVDFQYTKLKKIVDKNSDGSQKTDSNGQPVYKYIDDGLLISKDSKSIKNSIYFLDPDYDKVRVDFSQD